MPIPIQDLNSMMQCDCDDPVHAQDFDVTPDRIEVMLVCDGCGKMVSVEGPIETVSDVRYDKQPRLDQDRDCE